MMVYTSIVAFTKLYVCFLTMSTKSLAVRNPSKIYLKIRIKLWWEGSGKQKTLKCLVNLGVNSFLPPPGGLHAQTNDTFWMVFQNLSFLSQMPFLSTKDLRTYTGGMAPYCYSAGMFVSSMAIMFILPVPGPNKFFLILSNFDSTEDWSCEWDVVDVKINGEISILSSWMLFPVPEGPVRRTGWLLLFKMSMIKEYLQVSTVSTMISKKDWSLL